MSKREIAVRLIRIVVLASLIGLTDWGGWRSRWPRADSHVVVSTPDAPRETAPAPAIPLPIQPKLNVTQQPPTIATTVNGRASERALEHHAPAIAEPRQHGARAADPSSDNADSPGTHDDASAATS